MKNKIFITTAIDYANAVIHVGHAYEKLQADALARFYRIKFGDNNVHFITGTDAHGTTTQKAAEERNITPQQHFLEITQKDKEQIDSLNISYDRFITTTDADHKKFASEFFKKSFENGDIYKGTYEGYYCEGCEAHKTLSELNEQGQCPLHTTRQIQLLEEENYFFKWSIYTNFLKDMLLNNKLIVKPEGKRHEMLSFLEQGLNDITVSRPVYKVSWGISTPIDEDQVIYVWFDALINYLTEGIATGFWDEHTKIIHFVGKDIARWHVLLWPAMLESAGYRLPDEVYVHGFINLNGEKISKSKGNVLYPKDLVEKFGVDAVRYYLLKYGPITEDADISLEHFATIYNGELANGLGNTVARIAKLANKSAITFPYVVAQDLFSQEWQTPITEYRTDKILTNIWKRLTDLDKHINQNEPWTIKEVSKLKEVLTYEVGEIREISLMLQPFMPETAKKIRKHFDSDVISISESLFPRI